MWVMDHLCDGSRGSWVTKDDPFPSLKSEPNSDWYDCKRSVKVAAQHLPSVTWAHGQHIGSSVSRGHLQEKHIMLGRPTFHFSGSSHMTVKMHC